ncbi:MAG: hypothetical protein PHI23_04705, partial [Candidatus Peribacteraceae bacterium]|nr:hypothetical protein [Candidatus Peribacteraceae bacterium]
RKLRTPAEKKPFEDAQKYWKDGKDPAPEVLERTIKQYQEWRRQLDAVLVRNRIIIPGAESVEAPAWQEGNSLSRDQYFSLLVLVVQGKKTREFAEAKNIADLRALIADNAAAIERPHAFYTELLPEEMGPKEMLARHGVVIGRETRSAYMEIRSGTKESPLLPAGQSAAFWRSNPMLAYDFLSDEDLPFSQSESNQSFLFSLYMHYEPDAEKKRAMMEAFVGKYGDAKAREMSLSREATDATLELVIKSLLVTETEYAASSDKREELKERMTTGQTVEQWVKEAYRYMGDLKKHPVGSVLMGATAFIIIKWLYDFFFTDKHNKYVRNLVVYPSIIGAAIGLYQQHKHGKAWWESLGELAGLSRGKKPEDVNERERDTLADYWARECGITDSQERECLLLLGNHDCRDVLQWYGRMDQAMLAGTATEDNDSLLLPFELDDKVKDNVFGREMNDINVAKVFYRTLHKFFAQRGKTMRGRLGEGPGMERDNAALGYSIINKVYVERKPFSAIEEVAHDAARLRGRREGLAGADVYDSVVPPLESGGGMRVLPASFRRSIRAGHELVRLEQEAPAVEGGRINMWVIFNEQAGGLAVGGNEAGA